VHDDVWVLGGHQSDFARNTTREGTALDAFARQTIDAAVADAGIDVEQIETIHVANAFGELFTGQAHLGALPATAHPGLVGIPAGRHEGACASGSLAVRGAMADLLAGLYDVALVLGIEIERNVDATTASDHLGAATWVADEARPGTVVWAEQFSRIADAYDRRHGLDDAHLRSIGAINLANAKRNPLAQTRDWNVPDVAGPAGADDDVNPIAAGRLRRYDCSQITDGAVALVLVSDRWREANPTRTPLARVAGWGHRTTTLPLDAKLAAADETDAPLLLPHVAAAFTDALHRADTDLGGVAGLETHDCFTSSEYLAIDHIGLTPPGQSWRAIEDGTITAGGAFPINPSGGLIGGGHPVGATGVRMVLDAAHQVSDTAGETQVPGAERFATLNIGGSTATVLAFVLAAG
jgi:acetyl-CoA C-acetyltransferase